MAGNIGEGRPVRVCDLCGGVDDHPRHVIDGTDPDAQVVAAPTDDIVNRVLDAAPAADRARLLRDLMDTASSDRHLDCCAAAGCPLPADDEHNCATRTAGAESKTGRQLLAHLTKEA